MKLSMYKLNKNFKPKYTTFSPNQFRQFFFLARTFLSFVNTIKFSNNLFIFTPLKKNFSLIRSPHVDKKSKEKFVKTFYSILVTKGVFLYNYRLFLSVVNTFLKSVLGVYFVSKLSNKYFISLPWIPNYWNKTWVSKVETFETFYRKFYIYNVLFKKRFVSPKLLIWKK